jgi:hypothetical protein
METRDIWCQNWSDLTELYDLRLCRVVISLHCGDTTDTGNAGRNERPDGRQAGED